MSSSFFTSNLVLFAVVTVAATFGQSYLKQQQQNQSLAQDANGAGSTSSAAAPATRSGSSRSLWRAYIVVYALVMGADWLQGPYMYPLYSIHYEFTDRTVATLFVFGFCAGGVSAPYVGKWADKYGRKRMCLAFCGLYATSCFIVLIRSLPLLLIGRILGGISTSILFSCFEAWLISSAHSLNLPDAELSSILSRCTFINGAVAAFSGIFSNLLVDRTGTVKAPFVASALCLGCAAIAINTTWTENYGGEHGYAPVQSEELKPTSVNLAANSKSDIEAGSGHLPTITEEDGSNIPLSPMQPKSPALPSSSMSALQTILADPSLLTLGVTQTMYETAMYLFVFLWVPALQVVSHTEADLPFGIIFSAFMCCMSLGSVVYAVSSQTSGSAIHRHASLASITCLVAAAALVTSAMSASLAVRFWAFCVFEATVGMYFPILGTLRGTIIPDETRASFSALFRVPLNVLVTISLITGAEEHKDLVILASVAMLAIGSVAMVIGIRRRVQ